MAVEDGFERSGVIGEGIDVAQLAGGHDGGEQRTVFRSEDHVIFAVPFGVASDSDIRPSGGIPSITAGNVKRLPGKRSVTTAETARLRRAC